MKSHATRNISPEGGRAIRHRVAARAVLLATLALLAANPPRLPGQDRMSIDAEGNVTVSGDVRAKSLFLPIIEVDGDLSEIRKSLLDYLGHQANDLAKSSEHRGKCLDFVTEIARQSGDASLQRQYLPSWIRMAQETGLKYDFKYKQVGEKRISFMATDVQMDTKAITRLFPCSDLPMPSDERLKTGVNRIGGALDRVRKLSGVTYHWNELGLDHLTRDAAAGVSAGPGATDGQNRELRETVRRQRQAELAGIQVGVLAQEVAAVFPEAVTTGDGGFQHVRYQDLLPLMIEAMKEQDKIVQEQAAELQHLAATSDRRERALDHVRLRQQAIESELAALRRSINKLAQEEGLAGLEFTGDPAVVDRK